MAEAGQLEQAGQGRDRGTRKGQAGEDPPHELGRGEPGPPLEPRIRLHALEPRIAADDGATRVPLGAQIAQPLPHRRLGRPRPDRTARLTPWRDQAISPDPPYT